VMLLVMFPSTNDTYRPFAFDKLPSTPRQARGKQGRRGERGKRGFHLTVMLLAMFPSTKGTPFGKLRVFR
jgi:hypothetical protein